MSKRISKFVVSHVESDKTNQQRRWSQLELVRLAMQHKRTTLLGETTPKGSERASTGREKRTN